MPWARVTPVFLEHPAGRLCQRPYHGHPRGCPNYGQVTHPSCPPRAAHFRTVCDLSRPVWAIWNRFDFAGHVAAMKARHPDWSQRQLECCLYWQPKARRALSLILSEFELSEDGRGTHTFMVPEARGINVTETMRSIGIELEWPPRTVTYQVALAGTPDAQALRVYLGGRAAPAVRNEER